MASVRRQPNGRYLVRYWGPDGRQRKRRFDRKGDADRFAATLEADKARGEWTDPRLGRSLLADYAMTWADTKGNVRARTRINVEGRLRNHIGPAFDGMAIGSIRPSDVRAFVTDLSARGLAPSTVAATYRTLGQILNTAVIDGLIPRSPCLGVELPAETAHEEMHFLTVEQVEALAGAHADRFRAAIYTAAFTGLRAGELWALRLPRVNLLRRRLEIVEALSEVRGELVTGPTKTRNRRTVTLPAFLAEMLGEHLGQYPSVEGYLFTAPEGGPVRHHNYVKRHFRPAVARASLPESLRFHDLRHTCAAILISQGWNAKQLQERLGHASIRTTLDRYAHLFEGHDAVLLEGLDARVRQASVSKTCPERVQDLPKRESGARLGP